MPPRLGVNIDHVATVRQARRTDEPDPAWAAVLAQLGGADSIVCHLREDRRHVNDRDLMVLKQVVANHLNLEMGLSDEIIAIALQVKPNQVTLVPEKRQELTTEGGLDVAGGGARIAKHVKAFHKAGIEVSLFIDANDRQIRAAKKAGADIVELHTGVYAHDGGARPVVDGAKSASKRGLRVFAGHGLTYRNIEPIARIREIAEYAIGHSIVSRAVLVGMERAVREMKDLILRGRGV